MKKLPFFFTQKAVLDIEDIWLYTAERWSAKQADRYYALILDEIDHICSNPALGRSMEHVRHGYRASKVKSHLIFYKVNNEIVEVVRILHERMDIENRLIE